MTYFFLDASALGKRYAPERGSPLVTLLFDLAPWDRFTILTVAVGEVVSILVRKRNDERISPATYQAAMRAVRAEIISAGLVEHLPITHTLVNASLPLIEQRHVNSTDAAALRAALDLATILRPDGNDIVFVASDRRLVNSAAAEGLTAFNPATDTEERLRQLIAA